MKYIGLLLLLCMVGCANPRSSMTREQAKEQFMVFNTVKIVRNGERITAWYVDGNGELYSENVSVVVDAQGPPWIAINEFASWATVHVRDMSDIKDDPE